MLDLLAAGAADREDRADGAAHRPRAACGHLGTAQRPAASPSSFCEFSGNARGVLYYRDVSQADQAACVGTEGSARLRVLLRRQVRMGTGMAKKQVRRLLVQSTVG